MPPAHNRRIVDRTTPSRRGRRGLHAICGVLLAILLLPFAGCRPGQRGRAAADAVERPRVETVRHNGVTLEMTFTPGSVSLDRDIILSLRLTHPESLSVTLPPLTDRLEGLMLSSSFERDTAPAADGRLTRERVLRLTPLIAPAYRLAPMAISCRPANGDGETSYIGTPPVVLPLNTVSNEPLDASLRGDLQPIYIRPSLKTISAYAAIPVVILLLLALAIFLLGRIQHKIRTLRMSPKERALYELERLLSRKWVESGHIKAFYLELTLIVRRYIERQHRIRAPEQTTHEFLQAVAADTRFTPVVIDRLKPFLEAADLVKFAAWRPDRHVVDSAITTAREYLVSDTETAEPPGKE